MWLLVFAFNILLLLHTLPPRVPSNPSNMSLLWQEMPNYPENFGNITAIHGVSHGFENSWASIRVLDMKRTETSIVNTYWYDQDVDVDDAFVHSFREHAGHYSMPFPMKNGMMNAIILDDGESSSMTTVPAMVDFLADGTSRMTFLENTLPFSLEYMYLGVIEPNVVAFMTPSMMKSNTIATLPLRSRSVVHIETKGPFLTFNAAETSFIFSTEHPLDHGFDFDDALIELFDTETHNEPAFLFDFEMVEANSSQMHMLIDHDPIARVQLVVRAEARVRSPELDDFMELLAEARELNILSIEQRDALIYHVSMEPDDDVASTKMKKILRALITVCEEHDVSTPDQNEMIFREAMH